MIIRFFPKHEAKISGEIDSNWKKFHFFQSRRNLYTVVVAANADQPATLQYIAPYTGAAVAEYFMYSGKHTLVVYD
ncbi:MAG: hypothetical protein AAF206_17365, partial [Bacteroidota bacterium]